MSNTISPQFLDFSSNLITYLTNLIGLFVLPLLVDENGVSQANEDSHTGKTEEKFCPRLLRVIKSWFTLMDWCLEIVLEWKRTVSYLRRNIIRSTNCCIWSHHTILQDKVEDLLVSSKRSSQEALTMNDNSLLEHYSRLEKQFFLWNPIAKLP